MNKIVFLVAFLAYVAANVVADKKIVCYFGSWAGYRLDKGKFRVSDINPHLCTHLIYTFVGLDTTGNVRILDSWMDLPDGLDGFGQFNRLRQASPGTKTMVAMGGWNEGSSKYSQVVANPATRARFVQSVVQFLKQYDFNGFDLDWEYPGQRGGQQADKQNFVQLLKELRAAFDKHGYILSVAVGANQATASQSYIISEISKHVHFINLMTYDFNGSWNSVTGLNAPLNPGSDDSTGKLNVNEAVKFWLNGGAAANKLIVGVASYGRSFTLANPGNNGVGAPTVGGGSAGPYTNQAGMLGYNEICEYLKQGWSVRRNKADTTPYAFKGNQWVGYDDVKSIDEKARYINSKGLGGAMMWSIETDDFHGSCGEAYPLLKTLNHVLRGGSGGGSGTVPPPVPTKPTTPQKPTPPPTHPPPTTSVCTREGYIRDPHNCGTFYYCKKVNNKFMQYTYHCAADLAFDPSINACNYRHLVPGC